MAATSFIVPWRTALDGNAISIPGAQAVFTVTGTTTLAPIYTDSGMATEATNPVVANAAGRFENVWLNTDSITYRMRLFAKGADVATATPIDEQDPYTGVDQGPKGEPGSPGEGYDTRSAMATAGDSATNLDDSYLSEVGREGKFIYTSSNISAGVTADPQQGVYVARSGDSTGATGGWVRQYRELEVEFFGAVGDNSTDNVTAFNAVIEFARLNNLVRINIGAGTFLVSDVIEASAEYFNLALHGAGTLSTVVEGTHNDGPVIRLNRSFSRIYDMTIDASSTRKAGSAGTGSALCCGLMIEPADTTATATASTHVARVRIINQPHSGFISIGNNQITVYDQVLCQDNVKHAFQFDDGGITGRSNKIYPGLFSLNNCWAVANGGHGLVIGNPNDSNDIPVRCVMNNCEFTENALDSDERFSAHDVWVRGENIVFNDCAFGSVTDTIIGAARWSGTNGHFNNCRFIRTSSSVEIEDDPVLTGNYGLRIDGMRVVANAHNPSVIDSTSSDSLVGVEVSTYGDDGNITAMFTAGMIDAVWNRFSPVSITRSTANQSVTNSTTLVDATSLEARVRINETAVFEANIRYVGDPAGDIKIAFTGPTGATIRWDNIGSLYLGTGDTVTVSTGERVEDGTRAFGASSSTRTISVKGYIQMSTTDGPLKLQFAQSSADATASTILANSYLKIYHENINV